MGNIEKVKNNVSSKMFKLIWPPPLYSIQGAYYFARIAVCRSCLTDSVRFIAVLGVSCLLTVKVFLLSLQ